MLLVVLLLAVGHEAPVAVAETMPVPLVTGWNNFGYLGPAQPVLAALSGIPGQYDGLVQWDAATQRWRTFNPGAPETSDFTDLTQGGAYWIHMLQPVILPVGISGGGGSSRQLQKGWNNVVQANPTAPVRDALASCGAGIRTCLALERAPAALGPIRRQRAPGQRFSNVDSGPGVLRPGRITDGGHRLKRTVLLRLSVLPAANG